MNGPHDENINRPRDLKGNTSLHELCTKHSTSREAITDLIAQGADINRENVFGIPPLGTAILNGNTSVARYLLEHGAELFFMTSKKASFNALNLAASQASLSMIDLLIEFNAGRYVNETGITSEGRDSHMPCLHLALHHGNAGMIDQLVSQGAYVNELAGPANQLSRPLHLAAKNTQPDAIRRLIKAGADIQQSIPPYGYTPIHSAIEAGRAQNVEALTQKGGDINAVDDRGITPLMLAAVRNNLSAAKELFKYYHLDIDKRIPMPPCRNALMHAAEQGHTEMVRLLVEHGANVTLADTFNNTAADIASAASYSTIAKTLRTVEELTNIRESDEIYRKNRKPPKQDK